MPLPPVPAGGREQGTVSRWTDRGFGFITPKDGGEDLFCHFSNIEDGNGLEPGSMVAYVKVYDERKGKERAEQVTGGITVEEAEGDFYVLYNGTAIGEARPAPVGVRGGLVEPNGDGARTGV